MSTTTFGTLKVAERPEKTGMARDQAALMAVVVGGAADLVKVL